nr:hypothetical protein [Coxiella-like endosymbiont of Rhipicephalus sanguineus]
MQTIKPSAVFTQFKKTSVLAAGRETLYNSDGVDSRNANYR